MDDISAERRANSVIMVVDDIELNRKMLSHSLLAKGYQHVITANDGVQALQKTREIKPDLVILDLMMPNMDGYAYCQAIRSDKSYDNMPIIVQTALDDAEKKLKAFELGASDYICKPINADELIARTEVHLNNKLMMEDLRQYRKQMTAEMDAARTMQQRLLPSAQQTQLYERVFDMKIASHFETSSALGGDGWGAKPLSDNHLAIFMYDFSGHGITAAMNVFRLHTIMQESMHLGTEPGTYLNTLNRFLYPLLERGEFATMFYGIIDTEANCLTYSSAASHSGIIFHSGSDGIISLEARGFPLGVLPNPNYETRYSPFIAGDLLLLYSDCLIETRNDNNIFLELSQVTPVISESLKMKSNNPSRQAIDVLLHMFRQHSSKPVVDDFTINAYYRCPAAE